MNGLQRKTATARPARRGLSAIEVVVVAGILLVFALLAAMILPRRRETARMAACRRNLMQIGAALALYDQTAGSLPYVPAPDGSGARPGSGPLRSLLEGLGLPDLTAVEDPRRPPPNPPGSRRDQPERRVPGFVCASDPNAIAGIFPAPVGYRACTGDTPDGRHGAFAPGRSLGVAQVEAADGSSYTVGFSERLVGDNRPEHPAPNNYAVVPGPLAGTGGCPRAAISAWRGDAGSSWAVCDWQSTLYNHALTPNAAPSCIADDRRQAFLGASSGHVEGVNVLFLDGGVRTFLSRVDPKIWRALADVPDSKAP
jgi:prepilin-type processing-associated H-X9-DG protein